MESSRLLLEGVDKYALDGRMNSKMCMVVMRYLCIDLLLFWARIMTGWTGMIFLCYALRQGPATQGLANRALLWTLVVRTSQGQFVSV